ncbi:hypothetical protein B1F73_05585 [Pseudomonas syringae]|uniref:Uncharacterized protein n=1 Tax=Pseudomonas syringae TaxID=317 RepID=A0AB37ZMB5_PSESX|nr:MULTISPECIES: hypothetical protein [Pseudomonas]MBI6669886.1 hypothetical protein [Pseudomonas syringae]MBI6680058.1 hypothetical protein [Pseudomonas syringae]MBI6839973.1 hypothetical protein [Pseudomonas syringae]NAP05515.1 hypothetical protein [Pseudomonas syringae]NAP21142.1 hypothetical protein [Pseudomonas syringae]
MRQSLIDSIGREISLRLMGGAVLQAIEENYRSSVLRKAKTAKVGDRASCVVEASRKAPPVGVPSSGPQSLSKQVPIA